ncbi:hypothetical protein BGW42_004666 [Actinomortierella wolfii]|nr:hypothetical protein BGW42_004666 [Actinomortierella wolfii]
MDSYFYLDQRTKEILASMTAKNRGQQHHRSGPHSQYQYLPQSHETNDITTSAAAAADELSESGTELEGEGDSDGHEEISTRDMNHQHKEHSEGYHDNSFLSASGVLRAGMNTANNNNSNSKSPRPSRQYSRDYHSHYHPQPQRHRTTDIAGDDGANSLSDSGGMPLSEADDDDSGDDSDGDSARNDVFVDKGGYHHRNRRSPSITTGQILGDASVLDSMQDQVEHIYERLETSKVEQQRLQQWILERSHYEEDLRNQWIESKKQMEYMLVQLQQMFDQQRVQNELLRKDFLEPLQLLQQQSHSHVFDSGAKSQLSLPNVEEGAGGMEVHLQESMELEKDDGQSVVSIPLAASSSNLSKEEIRLRHLEYKRYSHPIQYHSQREDTTRMQERKRELERTENEGPIVDDPDITSPTERSSSEVSIYRTQDQDTTITKDITTANGAVSLITAYPFMFLTHFVQVWMYNPIRWLFKVCFWMLVLMILQVWVIDLFFLPPTTRAPIATNMPTSPSSSSTHQLVNVAHYKNRDYIADQPGYYTVANDGFGTETLAYCHDLARLEYLEQDLAYLQMHRKTWAAIVMSGIRKAQQQTIHWLWTHGATAAEKLGVGRIEQWLVDRLVESRKQRRRGQPKMKAAMITGKSDGQPTKGLRDTHQ